jgi:hypothetical protein
MSSLLKTIMSSAKVANEWPCSAYASTNAIDAHGTGLAAVRFVSRRGRFDALLPSGLATLIFLNDAVSRCFSGRARRGVRGPTFCPILAQAPLEADQFRACANLRIVSRR